MKHEKTLLRRTAAMAKTRLVTGFWNQDHDKNILENLNNQNREEEQIYRRVVNVLRCGENPLSELLDHDFMATLDDAARQRYVLNMSERVNKSIERFNKVC